MPEVELESKSNMDLIEKEEGTFVKTDSDCQCSLERVFVIGNARIIHDDFEDIIKESEDVANLVYSLVSLL